MAAQFWGETVLTTLCALVLGVGLARVALPVFNRLAAVDLQLGVGSPSLWLALAGLMLVVGLVAGGYPALALSRFALASVLRGRGGPGGRSRLTRALVVLQFALATGLVTGVFVMQRQFDYISDKNLGFDEERVVVMKLPGMSSSEGKAVYEPFKNALTGHSAIEQVTGGLSVPGGGMPLDLQVSDMSAVQGYVTPVARNYTETLGIELLGGRDLSQTESDDALLVNEELVQRMGGENPIGKELPFSEGASKTGKMMAGGTVVGVIGDYHFRSLREPIAPLVLSPRAKLGGGVNQIAVRIRAGAVPQALDVMETAWQQLAPDRPFEYTFLEDDLMQQYETERRWRAIASYAAGLALLISCAGLFGLALLTVQRRKKKIGIRKVMGASAWNVVTLVAKQFALLVAVGFALAVPLAWWGARRWLQTFAYRIELGAAPFLVAGLAVLIWRWRRWATRRCAPRGRTRSRRFGRSEQ